VSAKSNMIYEALEHLTAASTDDVVLRGPPVPENCIVELKVMRVVDLTTANKTMRLGFERAGVQYWFRRRNAGTGNYDLHLEAWLLLMAGERPIAMVESPTVGDELWFFARGYCLEAG